MRGVENSINPLNRLREWPLLVSQFLGSAAAGAALSIGILLAEQVTESESWATVIRASGWLAAAVFARPLNELAVRRSRRFAMLTGWILATAGTALISFAASLNSTPLTVAGMTATGAGAAAMLQARFAIAEMVLPQQRAAAIVRLTWAGALGSIAGPSLGFLSPLGRLLAGANEHSSSYAVAAVLMVVGTLTLLALRPPPDQPDSNRQNTSAASPAVANPGLLTVGAACAVAQFTMTAAMTSAPLHLHRIGVSANAIGVIVSVHMVGMYAFAPVIAALNKRLSNGPRALMSLSMAVLAAALLSALLNASLAMVVIRLFFVGLGWSAIQLTTSLVFAAASETGSQRAVRTQGALDMVISLAGGLGIGFAGILQSAAEYHLTQAAYGVLPLVWIAWSFINAKRKAAAV